MIAFWIWYGISLSGPTTLLPLKFAGTRGPYHLLEAYTDPTQYQGEGFRARLLYMKQSLLAKLQGKVEVEWMGMTGTSLSDSSGQQSCYK